MASKQPFKLIDWKQKIVRLSLRVNKFFKHKILSKSRNALILSDSQSGVETHRFTDKLKGSLKKTWEIYEINVNRIEEVENMG